MQQKENSCPSPVSRLSFSRLVSSLRWLASNVILPSLPSSAWFTGQDAVCLFPKLETKHSCICAAAFSSVKVHRDVYSMNGITGSVIESNAFLPPFKGKFPSVGTVLGVVFSEIGRLTTFKLTDKWHDRYLNFSLSLKTPQRIHPS